MFIFQVIISLSLSIYIYGTPLKYPLKLENTVIYSVFLLILVIFSGGDFGHFSKGRCHKHNMFAQTSRFARDPRPSVFLKVF